MTPARRHVWCRRKGNERKRKKQQLWKELLLYLESSWVDVEELEIVGKLLKKAFLILLRRKLCSHWPECNKSNGRKFHDNFVTVVEFNDFFGFEFILKKRISLFFQVDDLVLSSWIDPSAVTNEKEEGARGLVLFNKQTVKDFERLFMKILNGKWKPKRFGWKPPTAGKVGKYFDSFPIYFLFTRLVCGPTHQKKLNGRQTIAE